MNALRKTVLVAAACVALTVVLSSLTQAAPHRGHRPTPSHAGKHAPSHGKDSHAKGKEHAKSKEQTKGKEQAKGKDQAKGKEPTQARRPMAKKTDDKKSDKKNDKIDKKGDNARDNRGNTPMNRRAAEQRMERLEGLLERKVGK